MSSSLASVMPKAMPVAAQPLADLCDRIMVGIASAATHAYRPSGIPMIRNMNIKEGHIEADDLLFLDPGYEHQHRNKRLRAGDVVVVRTGNPGVAAVVPAALENAQCFTSLVIRPKREVLDPEYLCAFINSHAGQRQFSVGAAGGAQKNVNAATLSRMTIPVPLMTRQRAVVAAARELDGLRRQTTDLIDATRILKRGLMQQLLTGRKRFPEFRDRSRHLAQVEDFASLVGERVDPKKSSEALRCIELEHIESATGRLLGESSTAKTDSIKAVFEEGDVLFGKLRPYLRKFARPRFRGACSPEIWALRPDPSKVRSAYLYHIVDSVPFRRAANAVSGSKMPRADWSVVAEATLWLPELDEQVRIAAVLDALDLEIELLTAKREKLEVFRRALLSLLLSGSLPVPS